MQPVLAALVDLLALERLDRDLFRGRSQDLGWGAIFGGQVLGQALSAAAQTVGADRPVHSLHGYFMRAGDVRKPIVYQVDRLRDGATFTTRRVAALQEGEAIFSLEASFQLAVDGATVVEIAARHLEPLVRERPVILEALTALMTRRQELASEALQGGSLLERIAAAIFGT